MEQEVIEGYRLSPQQKHLWSFLEGDSAAAYRSRLVKIEELELSAEAAAGEGLAAVLSRMGEAAPGERAGEFRVQLVKESEQRVGLVLTVSAMQADEQGMKNLAQEIVSSYEAIVQN